MIRLCGFSVKEDGTPNGDISIVYTGLRAGEKLYEELLIGENATGTYHPRILKAREDFIPYAELQKHLDSLRNCCTLIDDSSIINIMHSLPLNYAPAEALAPFTKNILSPSNIGLGNAKIND